jgi:hypothetical protein
MLLKTCIYLDGRLKPEVVTGTLVLGEPNDSDDGINSRFIRTIMLQQWLVINVFVWGTSRLDQALIIGRTRGERQVR